jgi:hypothetical protein
MKTYLSVDLDYWAEGTRAGAEHFFAHVLDLKLPIFVAPFHDQLLEHINANSGTHLYQIDYHSDITDLAEPALDLSLDDLNEGSWANFVEWKESGRFVWRHPKISLEPGDGYCHDRNNPFEKDCSGWRETRRATGLGCIPWKTIHAVGVCLSSDWLRGAPVQRITDRLGISAWRNMSLKSQRKQRPFLWTAVWVGWKAAMWRTAYDTAQYVATASSIHAEHHTRPASLA